MSFWKGVPNISLGTIFSYLGANAALSSNDILVQAAGIVMGVSGAIVAYTGLIEDTGYANYGPHKLFYDGLKGLYKKLV